MLSNEKRIKRDRDQVCQRVFIGIASIVTAMAIPSWEESLGAAMSEKGGKQGSVEFGLLAPSSFLPKDGES